MEKQNRLVAGLSLISLVCLIAAYFAPIWWVSLTAPNYPEDAFPDGIRIHFHFDGVYNGCKAAGKGTRMANEIIQKDLAHDDERYNPVLDAKKNVDKGAEGLDCVHEMNTINHYVAGVAAEPAAVFADEPEGRDGLPKSIRNCGASTASPPMKCWRKCRAAMPRCLLSAWC